MTQRLKNPQLVTDPRYGLSGKVYIGIAGQDPTANPSSITMTDGVGGEPIQSPLTLVNGEYKNTNGNTIYPVLSVNEYSIAILNENDNIVYQRGRETVDISGAGGGGGSSIYDDDPDNLDDALADDLSAYDFIFIYASSAGWRGTATGADINSAYYRTGLTGSPSTGDADKFYDANGNEWVIAPSRVDVELSLDVAAQIAASESTLNARMDDIEGFAETKVIRGSLTRQSTNFGSELSSSLAVLPSGASYQVTARIVFGLTPQAITVDGDELGKYAFLCGDAYAILGDSVTTASSSAAPNSFSSAPIDEYLLNFDDSFTGIDSSTKYHSREGFNILEYKQYAYIDCLVTTKALVADTDLRVMNNIFLISGSPSADRSGTSLDYVITIKELSV